jgi:hypothetical protein
MYNFCGVGSFLSLFAKTAAHDDCGDDDDVAAAAAASADDFNTSNHSARVSTATVASTSPKSPPTSFPFPISAPTSSSSTKRIKSIK